MAEIQTTVPMPGQENLEPKVAEAGSQAMNAKDENARFLLEQKLGYINMAGNVCTTWWVSSVVFCASILAAVWLNRTELVQAGIIFWLGLILFVFFGSIVTFGTVSVFHLRKVRAEISRLAGLLDKDEKDFFSTELTAFRNSLIIATSSFVLIWGGWTALWLGLWFGYWKK
ncbi:MAG TPA: hypothetical protein VGB17_12140 [Pyrinomonadaceae bacterium]|jgi:hypothetical protein